MCALGWGETLVPSPVEGGFQGSSGKAFPASSVPQEFMKSVVRIIPTGLCCKSCWGDLRDASEGIFTCRATKERSEFTARDTQGTEPLQL